jgi:hypothetical protein
MSGPAIEGQREDLIFPSSKTWPARAPALIMSESIRPDPGDRYPLSENS